MEVFVCTYCEDGTFAAPSKQLFDQHISLAHSQDSNFVIQCSHQACSRTFTNYRSYQNHLLKHDSRDKDELALMTVNQSMTPTDSPIYDYDDCIISPVNTNVDMEIVPSTSYLTDYCAKWILKPGETRKLTRTALLGIIEDSSQLIEEILTNVKSQVMLLS